MPTYVASSSADSISSSWSVARPSGTSAGHLLVAFVGSSGSASSIGTPTGGSTWQLLATISPFGMGAKLFWKAAGANEPSTYGFTQASSEWGGAIVVAVSEADTANTPQVETSTSGSGTSVATPSMTPLAAGDLDLRFGAALNFGGQAPSWSPPAGYTERQEVDAALLTAALATRTLESTSATGTVTFTVSSSPDVRAGAAVLVTSPPSGRPRIVVATAAAQRAASW